MIVDDEKLAREGIRVWLEKEPDVELVGEAADGPSAVTMIQDLLPSLLFLDIQMPGFDAFEVLERAATKHLPAVVFVTAYDRYAVQAFEARALDYLLKPISGVRFHEALQRVREDLVKEEALGQTRQRIDYLLEESRVLRAVNGSRRLRLTDDQRRRLAVKGQLLGRRHLAAIAGIVTPDAILRSYRRLKKGGGGGGSRTARRASPSTSWPKFNRSSRQNRSNRQVRVRIGTPHPQGSTRATGHCEGPQFHQPATTR
jgi:DNA-binding NarL/FixJ family response regulator